MPTKTKFPKRMMVRFEDDGDGGFYISEPNLESMSDRDGETVAVYELKEVQTVHVTVELNGVRPK